jgi:hypothetical protein
VGEKTRLPFFYEPVSKITTQILRDEHNYTSEERECAALIQAHLRGTIVQSATTKRLNRYAIQPGKIFGANSKAPEKYKVLRLIVDDVVIQNISTQKVEVRDINRLLEEWDQKGVREISYLEELIQTVKNILGPFLGVFLTAALVKWLADQIK